ncbi:MAG: helix-turn-helix domain-containing protein [Maritimibacter sp.]|nr:helix-turn-helix domain-containing protein [Maritimibacter sp.]
MTVLEPIEKSNRDFVGSLAKGLRVLRAFNDEHDRLTLSDIARLVDLPRAGARRLLLTLHALGYVKTDGKFFFLSPKVLELGFSYLSSQHWLTIASPVLEGLRDALDEAVSVTTLEGSEVVYVARYPVDRVMTLAMDIGSRKPAYCTAMGRVLLGGLPETKAREILGASDMRQFTTNTRHTINDVCEAVHDVREKGYCLIDRELEDSLVAISVPLRNYHGEILAAVNVCGHPGNLTLADLEARCLPALQEATRKIAQMLV